MLQITLHFKDHVMSRIDQAPTTSVDIHPEQR